MRVLSKGLITINIYLEGPDATGKTTLAKRLISKYGFEYEHLDADSPNT